MRKSEFESLFEELQLIELPEFSGVKAMMLPIIIGNINSLPDFVAGYKAAFKQMCEAERAKIHNGEVGYLTVDEKLVEENSTHRRGGLHVDGIFKGSAGSWGGGGTWGSAGNGMLTVSSPAGCRAWLGKFNGWPGDEGECNHLADQCSLENATEFKSNVLYWVDGLCIHESIPQKEAVQRQFIRLSLPSKGPWFKGYTENPLGVLPTGRILPYRDFMKE